MAEEYTTPPEMQESYDKNKEPEFDQAVEDAVGSTEPGTRERADALLDAAELKKRLHQSIVGEATVGIMADFVTSPLLASPIPGSRPLYYGLNYGIGYGANVIAQKWRGGEFNKGEAVAAGSFQAIPFGTTAKGIKGLGRAAIKGGTGAVVGEQVRVGIDERRALTPGEAGTAFAIGGAFGGAFKGAIEGGSALKNKIVDIIDNPYKYAPEGSLAEMMYQTGGGIVKPPKGGDVSDAWFPKEEAKLRRIAKQRGWSITQAEQLDPTVFSDDSPSGVKKIFASDKRKRELASEALTDIEVTKEVNDLFKSSGKEMLAEYEDALGFTFKDIQVPTDIHHIAILRQIASATEGLKPEWRIKGGQFMAKRLRRKIGFDPENAIPLPRVFHKRLHNIINAQIGDGQWSIKGIEQKLNLPKDWKTSYTHRQRMKVYQEIIDPIARSVDHINLFWNQLQTRSGGTTLSAEEYMKQTLAVIDLDKLLQKTPSAGKTLTATQIIDDILEAAKVGWKSPVFKPLTADMTQEAIKLTRQENGWAALYEAVVMNQSYATLKKTYGFNVPVKLIKAIQKDDEAYQYMLRSRNQSVRLTDPRGTQGVNPDD